MRNVTRVAALAILLGAAGALGAPPAPAPAPKIPGLTAPDTFPGACVDCHAKSPQGDERLSTAMTAWRQAIPASLLAKAQAATPAGAKLKGKHPAGPASLTDVPNSCAKCHKADSKLAPPMGQMVHVIHLTGAGNEFLGRFGGQCTHCHKLDAAGRWKVPSGPEKK